MVSLSLITTSLLSLHYTILLHHTNYTHPQLRSCMDHNVIARSHIGAGYYGTHTPAVILRNILESPLWYTAYTPYQVHQQHPYMIVVLLIFMHRTSQTQTHIYTHGPRSARGDYKCCSIFRP
jgi:hypothetical protein